MDGAGDVRVRSVCAACLGVWFAYLLLAAGPARAEVSEGTTISADYKGTASTSYNVPPLGGGLEESGRTIPSPNTWS